ncbi:hypothetical protein M2352_001415 [Azospirillum fermentarium]|uniref:di-heme-cytochrome C peroxidase n=1 Tax=Azospirillum fermentarium TaxID=1233114 RepID=UPI0022280441|nr:di-heme-cytochrome C peroxidase [Azospirillum fermentarium]MCW2245824.1 hypothetical protein [Azospirillum fermentarium]
MTKRILGVAALAGLMLSGCASVEPQPARPVSVKPPVQINGIWYLDQNWTDEARQWYYNTTQGSQIMPYDWFMALTDPQTKAPFVQSLQRFGYPAGTAGSGTADTLPLGFVKDTNPDKSSFIGMTCAACHTGDVTVNGQTLRIDGGVTTGDLYGFIQALSQTLHATVTVDALFEPFATRVLGPNATPEKRLELYNQVKDFDGRFALFVSQSTPATPWGPMRTDAFGMIFNRVSSIDLDIPANSQPPDAPVSYPVLWDGPHQPKVQWNGLLPNANAFDALGRNAGEVLGVFGHITLKPPTLTHYYYSSSVRARNLIDMEKQLRALRSPVWPDAIAGRVNTVEAAKGADLYQQNCVSCHALLPRDKTYTTAPITMVPLVQWAKPDDPDAVIKALDTMCKGGVEAAVTAKMVTVSYAADPKTALDALCRNVSTGPLAGTAMPPQLLGGTKLKNPDMAVNLLANAVIGAILSDIVNDPSLLMDLANANNGVGDPLPQPAVAKAAAPAAPLTTSPLVTSKSKGKVTDQHRAAASLLQASWKGVKNDRKTSKGVKALAETIKTLMAYKARPLDGVWASAPYMHNGSVPSLYEMLLPAAQRSVTFTMGGGALDPVKVGVDSTAPTSTFLFDTTKPGNRNTGHEFGAHLTDAERQQLVEFLKTL